jgi:MFS family permease
VRRRWSAWAEAVVVGGVAAIPAGALTSLPAIDTPRSQPPGERLLHLAAQRSSAWALIAAAVLGWAMWRRGRRRAWTAGLRIGAVYGAACGVVGSLLHGFGAFWLAPRKVDPAFLQSVSGDTIKDVTMAASWGITGAAIGALLGAVFTPSGVRRGMLAGLLAGAALGWAGRTLDVLDHDIARWVIYAVGMVGTVVAVEYLTRARSYGRQESRFARVPRVGVAG